MPKRPPCRPQAQRSIPAALSGWLLSDLLVRQTIRRRAELPASYFSRLKGSGVDISKHLLLDDIAKDPARLVFELASCDVPSF